MANTPPNPNYRPVGPFTPGQLDQHMRDRALERMRRGLPTFTRTETRERILGVTRGENGLQRYTRRSQAPGGSGY